jgi:biopolymer transport protein ExbB
MSTLLPYLQYVEIATMVLLLGLSIWSIGLMLERRRVFQAASCSAELIEAENLLRQKEFAKLNIWAAAKSGTLQTLLTEIAQAPQRPATIEAAARCYMQKKRQELEKGLAILATLGSNAPFVGLFGTVLGIIKAFSALSADQAASQAASQAVMSSVAMALAATAAGLLVAIPAVVAFNYFNSRLRNIITNCESLKNFYLSRLQGS